jgi:hypothetical protein
MEATWPASYGGGAAGERGEEELEREGEGARRETGRGV